MTDDLLARHGSARHPGREPFHTPPAGSAAAGDDATVDALGALSAALEVVEEARGHLYAFHRRSGEADLGLQDALTALRDAGHGELAGRIDEVLVGRDVVPGMWTFQLVEAYDAGYWSVFRDVERVAREELARGTPHLLEARMKADEQSR